MQSGCYFLNWIETVYLKSFQVYWPPTYKGWWCLMMMMFLCWMDERYAPCWIEMHVNALVSIINIIGTHICQTLIFGGYPRVLEFLVYPSSYLVHQFSTILIIGQFCLDMKVCTWYIHLDDIKNKNIVKYPYPTVIKKEKKKRGEVLIADTRMVSKKKNDTRSTPVHLYATIFYRHRFVALSSSSWDSEADILWCWHAADCNSNCCVCQLGFCHVEWHRLEMGRCHLAVQFDFLSAPRCDQVFSALHLEWQGMGSCYWAKSKIFPPALQICFT